MAADDNEKTNVRVDLVFCLFLIVLLVVFFVATLGYKPVTRRAPLIVMIPLAIMLVGQLAVLVNKIKKTRAKTVENSLLPKIDAEKLRKAVQLLLWMMFLLLMIHFAGHVGGIALFLILFLRFASHERWFLSISLGLVVAAALYVLFEVGLKIVLYPGAIYGYVSALIWS
ncbi:MAG: tripartite tricarboxylate transporter TctB family protein [Thermodesulfobacteriota bacterium]